jgi:thiol-disulfide isomerase/thioredoxin
MKRITVLAALLVGASLLAAVGAAFGQSMMSTGSGSADASSMMSPAPATADPKVGAELRAAKSTGRKVIFTDLAAAEALTAEGPVVLFFAADWCPYCQQDLKDINANGAKLSDVTIVVLDYDNEKAVKKQYGVTAQDTFVQIDAAGTKLGAWNAGGVAGILKRVVRS